ncbi:hypothetical protein GDO78_001888 [Eleutherodactylus coqui]|uniref:Transmembrane 4 L6 family member 18 n=1 Tax=Eleutherodactylus coqui TaxID=57060 RepID=A0A8J6KHP5_ELECQ|nr:hypothetical protein GDO78_001888 [Eleutherodactylus coqui]
MFLTNCSEYSILAVIPLAVWSIVVNILLYFPNGVNTYAANNQLTNYVWYFQGICFGGILMIILSAVLLLVDFYKCSSTCCAGKQLCHIQCSKLETALFALLGVLFSGYSLIISSLGLSQGPYCRTDTGWRYPFANTGGSRIPYDRMQRK